MTGQLITLPVRLWWRGTMFLVHTAEDATELALGTALRVAGTIENLRSGGDASSPPPTWSEPTAAPERADAPEPAESPEPSATRTPAPSATRTPAPRPAEPASNGSPEPLASERLEREGLTTSIDLESSAEPEPVHVSEEPDLVRESAEPGAEDGAGASLHVREPWEGYGRLSAREVVSRCRGASPAELAAVQLYERAHRNRRTVVEAVEREMKSAQPGH